MYKLVCAMSCLGLLFNSSCTYESVEPVNKIVVTDSVISYAKTIGPLVDAQCNSCHSNGSSDGDFMTYAGLKNKADNGSLYNRVVVVKDMPPSGSGTLTDLEISYMAAWIKQGSQNN